uniref:Uncharacterized protein n=1 Tax=Rhizophora mucronata TaxID=61149 RepID=A0A2P2NIW1_RHIMU
MDDNNAPWLVVTADKYKIIKRDKKTELAAERGGCGGAMLPNIIPKMSVLPPLDPATPVLVVPLLPVPPPSELPSPSSLLQIVRNSLINGNNNNDDMLNRKYASTEQTPNDSCLIRGFDDFSFQFSCAEERKFWRN